MAGGGEGVEKSFGIWKFYDGDTIFMEVVGK